MNDTVLRRKQSYAFIGLLGFAVATTLSALIDFRNITAVSPDYVAAGWIFGGFCQIFAGLRECKIGNRVEGSVLTIYGVFWQYVAVMSVLKNAVFRSASAVAPTLQAYVIAYIILLNLGYITHCVLKKRFFLTATLGMVTVFLVLDIIAIEADVHNAALRYATGAFKVIASLMAIYKSILGILAMRDCEEAPVVKSGSKTVLIV